MHQVTFKKASLVILGLLVTVVLIEVFLRIGGFTYSAIQEYSNRIFLKKNETYRILCLGESTTARQWPKPLEEILNKQNTEISFSVIDKGVIGTNSGIIVSQLRGYIKKYQPDMVISMMGINDEEINKFIDKPNSLYIYEFLSDIRTVKLFNLIKLHLKEFRKDYLEHKQITDYGINNYGSLCFKKAKKYFSEKQYKKAEDMYIKAVKNYPQNDRHLIGLYKFYRNQERYDDALATLMKVRKFGLNKSLLYRCIGDIYSCKDLLEEAEKMYKKAIILNNNDTNISQLLYLYQIKQHQKIITANNYRFFITNQLYRKMRRILVENKIKFICVQYPMRDISTIKKIFKNNNDVNFVDNESSFKNAVEKEGYDTYFVDKFAGDFGHCTKKGNKLLAENIAKIIMYNVFRKNKIYKF